MEKIGWQEEGSPKQPPALKPPSSSKPAKKTNPYKIKQCEDRIMALEEEQAAAQKALEAGDLSPELLRSLGERQKEIDRLYEELERLSKDVLF